MFAATQKLVSAACTPVSETSVRPLLATVTTALEASARARKGMPERELRPPVAYRVLHKPFVYVRAAPSTRAAMLGILRPGDEVLAGCEHDGWLRTAMPFDKGRHGWLLLDGAPLGMGQLLARADAIPVI